MYHWHEEKEDNIPSFGSSYSIHALVAACACDNAKIVKMLLLAGTVVSDGSERPEGVRPALHWACLAPLRKGLGNFDVAVDFLWLLFSSNASGRIGQRELSQCHQTHPNLRYWRTIG
jgi:hypothetical protein